VLPAPTSVFALPFVVGLLALVDPDELALLLELLELEPHAATPSEAATTRATAPKRLVLKSLSLT